jgi:di/tricarboxylate transporter
MTWEGWTTLAVIVGVLVILQRRGAVPTDLLFLGALVLLTLLGIVTPQAALAGFSNSGVLMVGALFVVAAGLRNTGVLDWVAHRLLGRVRDEATALRRLAATIVPISAFIPNTPLVAMFLPVLVDWCRKTGVSPSRVLIPLSYLAVLGGVCTLIGTSTNVVSNSLLKEEHSTDVRRAAVDAANPAARPTAKYSARFRDQLAGMGLFEIGRAGIPCAVVGAAFLVLFGRRLLPARKELVEQLGEARREYLVEMVVRPECRLVDQTVEGAGLRHLPGLFLIEINRAGELIAPVGPTDVIRQGDRLVFTGVVATIVDLERIVGLVPAADLAYEFHPHERQRRHLTEVVLSRSSPLIGASVRKANFRQRYGAAVVAVHRSGKRLPTKIGDIVLAPGDTLLLQTQTDFARTFQDSPEFYLVSSVDSYTPVRHDRAWIATALAALMVIWLGAEGMPAPFDWPGWASLTHPALASITIAGLMVATRCLPVAQARSALDIHVLITIAGALGLGKALQASGAAAAIAGGLIDLVGPRPWLLLVVIYVLAVVLTELLSNAAVVAMLIPLIFVMAAQGEFSPRPFVMGVTIAASLSFLTPIGYQTNLMVMGPGGYRAADYFRVGWPLTALTCATALVIIPFAWPFAL